MSTALIPGSFDPFTLGHVNLVERAAGLFDRVVVAIMVNGEKDSAGSGRFTYAQREAIAAASLAHLDRVEVIADAGLLVDLAERIGATCLCKGVRGIGDFDYEYNMAAINRHIEPAIETVLLPAEAAYEHLSATFAREMIRYGRPLEGVLHPAAIPLVEALRA